jgi:hypothetical protein
MRARNSNQPPCMPFPSAWQRHLPQDWTASGFDAYADCVDIHF